MKTSTERTVYLVGLIAALFFLLAILGLPSILGTLVLIVILIFGWRLGVVWSAPCGNAFASRSDTY